MQEELKSMDYKDQYTDLIPENVFRISPSMIYKFTERKWEWYRNQVLGETTFEGNTSTVLGTCIHRVAEEFIKTGKVDKQALFDYVDKQSIDIDVEFIKQQIKPMGNALLDYFRVYGLPNKSEFRIATELMEGVWVGGTVDAMIGTTIIDIKTTSEKSPKMYIPNNYKWQLLTYAWIARKLGIEVNTIQILWVTNDETGRVSETTGKRLKDYPAQVVPVTNIITEEDMQFIEDYLKLIGETYLESLKQPNIKHLLFSDYRLKDI